jgi:nitronate monooxygenase
VIGGTLPDALADILGRLSLPVIAAPMLRVSGLRLVEASCKAGVIGAFPTANCRSTDELDDWLAQLRSRLSPREAPFCPNLIMRSPTLGADLDRLIAHGVELVITSVGSPEPVVAPLRKAGCLVFADVASLQHAHRAIRAGADGLVLLTAGAGGQTGWANPFAFVRAVRAFFDGPLILAGGLSDGVSLRAAQVLGCDLGYMGTRFIATQESAAPEAYKQMLVDSGMDDVILTPAFTGLPTSILRPSVRAAGLDPDALDRNPDPDVARALYGPEGDGPRRWRDIWSAGHSVSGVQGIPTVDELVGRLSLEYTEQSLLPADRAAARPT